MGCINFSIIGAIIGIAATEGSFVGGLVGYVVGYLIDRTIAGRSVASGNQQRTGQSNTYSDGFDDFLYNLIYLSADVIFADGRIYETETAFLRNSLQQSFGSNVAIKGMNIFTRLKDLRRAVGIDEWNRMLIKVCREYYTISSSQARWQILAFLAELAKSKGTAGQAEIRKVRNIAYHLGFDSASVDQFFALGGTTLDDAYKVLGVSPDATDDEVRKAYKKLALQHHPDRVSHLGEEVKNAAVKKMQEINKAKDAIYAERNIK